MLWIGNRTFDVSLFPSFYYIDLLTRALSHVRTFRRQRNATCTGRYKVTAAREVGGGEPKLVFYALYSVPDTTVWMRGECEVGRWHSVSGPCSHPNAPAGIE